MIQYNDLTVADICKAFKDGILLVALIRFLQLYLPRVCSDSLHLSQGAILIHEVNEGGAAHRDGRLMAGDHILEVFIILSK